MRFLLVLLIICICSCGTNRRLGLAWEKKVNEVPGVYKGKVKGINDLTNLYTLTINSDGTFIYEIKAFESHPKCSGEWKFVKNDSILCECSKEEDISIVLSNGYMNQRKNFFRVFHNGMLQLEDVLLWKQTD